MLVAPPAKRANLYSQLLQHCPKRAAQSNRARTLAVSHVWRGVRGLVIKPLRRRRGSFQLSERTESRVPSGERWV